MMGIVEEVLVEFELSDGTDYRVEYNKGGTVHMHIDTIRIDFTPDELRYFAKIVTKARNRLIEIKEYDAAEYENPR